MAPQNRQPIPSPVPEMDVVDVTMIGANAFWAFLVGRTGSSWFGAAIARDVSASGGVRYFAFFPEITHDGIRLGVPDRALCIRQTCAVALNPEDLWGGIDEWLIPEAERGTLADLPPEPEAGEFDAYDELDGRY